jgi:putative ABC transport system permease protein
MNAVMVDALAALAVALTIVGIYSIVAVFVSQRTREIGIRIALGAARRDVSGLFLRHGLILAAVGIGIGMIAAAAATRVMTALLFGVSALDPLTYVAVAVALGGTALMASYLPAMRATRIDPAVALRTEA